MQDIVFLLDASGSVEKTFSLIQDLAIKIVQGLNFASDRTRVGILTFSRNAKVRLYLKDLRLQNTIISSIAYTIENTGHTNIAAALNLLKDEMFTRSSGARPDVENIAVLITDGKATRDQDKMQSAAKYVKEAGIRLFTVGVGDADLKPLRIIATAPIYDYVYAFTRESQMNDVANQILDVICR